MKKEVFYKNVTQNEDGTINFDVEVKHDGTPVSSGHEINIEIDKTRDIKEVLKDRVMDDLEVYLDGEAIGNGNVPVAGGPNHTN